MPDGSIGRAISADRTMQAARGRRLPSRIEITGV
jgi:hypothetical protein